ncbi:MAG: NAD(P)H-binding protein [Acidobacteriia bacterium]|nr:NAD(P)H-binding protein [Terriglobia bacterium]
MDVVTGAFGYIGRYIARALLERGREVRTITTHPNKPNPFGQSVQAFSYSFDDPHRLTQTLEGADTLYNTYWIRFPFDGQTYESALANTRTLFQCAKKASVKRIVHIGVTQASIDSPLPYYRGKALQELGIPSSRGGIQVVFDLLVKAPRFIGVVKRSSRMDWNRFNGFRRKKIQLIWRSVASLEMKPLKRFPSILDDALPPG